LRQTKKYRAAQEIATLTHQSQEDLYSQLNNLGWFWNSKNQTWERDDRLAEPASNLLRIRVWAAADKVENLASIVAESLATYGLELLEQSEAYPCRPPKQSESRVYLTLTEREYAD